MDAQDITALTRGAKVFDLGVELANGIPHSPLHAPFMYQMIRQHGDFVYAGGASAAIDLICCPTHIGTHIDGFGHYSKDGQLCGGIPTAGNQEKLAGLKVYGMETVTPIVRRGVLLDVAAFRNMESLPPQYGIEPKELEETAQWAKVAIRSGDVVLVRTGYLTHWPTPTYANVRQGMPGVTLPGAQWLSAHGIFLGGADTLAFEKIPEPAMPVHVHFLVEKGIHILEVANLEGLSEAKAYEFLFVALPLKIIGATGSPVRPIAIV
ncbi:MAG: cyclase family protein [Candidatus Methylomirabilota bacterium]|jgi:kynurenine formamidase